MELDEKLDRKPSMKGVMELVFHTNMTRLSRLFNSALLLDPLNHPSLYTSIPYSMKTILSSRSCASDSSAPDLTNSIPKLSQSNILIVII